MIYYLNFESFDPLYKEYSSTAAAKCCTPSDILSKAIELKPKRNLGAKGLDKSFDINYLTILLQTFKRRSGRFFHQNLGIIFFNNDAIE